MSNDRASENSDAEHNDSPDWAKHFISHLHSFSDQEEWKKVCGLWIQQEMKLGWDENQGGKSVQAEHLSTNSIHRAIYQKNANCHKSQPGSEVANAQPGTPASLRETWGNSLKTETGENGGKSAALLAPI